MKSAEAGGKPSSPFVTIQKAITLHSHGLDTSNATQFAMKDEQQATVIRDVPG
jgi:hypothetical protein